MNNLITSLNNCFSFVLYIQYTMVVYRREKPARIEPYIL